MKEKKDFISIKDLSVREIKEIFSLTDSLKRQRGKFVKALKNKSIGLIFQKPSLRTRVSFEVGIKQLGGECIYLSRQELKLGEREAIKDVARTLSRYLDGVVLRTFSHQDILEFSRYAEITVINGLSDLLHPCQVLSDLYTMREKLGRLKGINLAYVGDGNNICHSLIYGAGKLGLNLRIATPPGYEPKRKILNPLFLSHNPKSAVKNADIIYTDVWTSMGKEKERQKRIKAFRNFQVNSRLVSLAKDNCLIMHCLPAHRGEEITSEIIDGRNSIVFDQAENRLHLQKAILISLLKPEILNSKSEILNKL